MNKYSNNKKWVYNKYINKKLSTEQIGKLCGVSHTTIGRWLKKFNIPVRPLGEAFHLVKANHCNLSKEAIEWINGELLGDGCIISQSPHSAYFIYASKYKVYMQYISNTLKSFGIKRAGQIRKYYHKDTNCYTYHYCSLCYEELLPIRKQWYPNGKKIVPKDISLTSITLRQHYIGDGCLIHHKTGRPYIRLATCGFLISDVEWLIKKLINLNFKATIQMASNTIHISTHSTKDFLNYIGKCPVNCYNYKFEY